MLVRPWPTAVAVALACLDTFYEGGDAYEVVRQVELHVSPALVVYSTAKKRSWSVDKRESLLVERRFRSNHCKFVHSLLEYMVRMIVVYH